MMNRLFISLDIPSEIQDKVIQIRDSIYGFDPKIKWEAKNKLHLTLKFLGDVSKDKNSEIIAVLDEVIYNHGTLELSFSRFGLFYRDNYPVILWVGFTESEELMNLNNEVEQGMVSIGFKKEKRKFKPHITLLRLKGFEDINEIKKFTEYNLGNIKFYADTISLMKSKLTPQGSIYTHIKDFKMK